jgi:uncharacterized membrane protein (DUF106 family)
METFLNNINGGILTLTDPLLGWLLKLPTDAALILVSVGTGAILTFARLLTTNQDLLRRCRQDKKRLKQRTREAKAAGDRAAVKRYRTSLSTIALKTLRAEGKPFLLALLPIILLATWCFQRLAWMPPRAGDTVPMVAYFSISVADDVVHVVPQDGLAAENGWVQPITAVDEPADDRPPGVESPYATATWELSAETNAAPYTIEIRYKTETYQRPLLVGQPTYSAPVEYADEGQPLLCTEWKLQPVMLFGVLPGIPQIGLAPWLAAYLLLAIPSISLLKRVTGIQ